MAARTGKRVVMMESAQAAVDGADIVAAATNSLDPVIEPDWMRDGVHLCCITVNEVGSEVVEEVDRIAFHTKEFTRETSFRPGAEVATPQQEPGWWTAGDAPFRNRLVDLGDFAAGHAPGRERADEVTLFVNNIGMGLQFAAVGALVFEAAHSRGLGRELPTDWLTETVHP